jgi:hypothetical protein
LYGLAGVDAVGLRVVLAVGGCEVAFGVGLRAFVLAAVADLADALLVEVLFWVHVLINRRIRRNQGVY